MLTLVRRDSADVAAIAKNTDWSEVRISRVKDHLFYKEHQLGSGLKQFDADPDMFNAWNRLTKGDYFKSDIDFIRHDIFE
ncbi:hypothetical protein [Achromobacter sp.]|uniref:hypothetical protein n=1 Tax=Achromobacter sp. TaxID=134375 RepID=UPI003C78EEF2